MLVTKTFRFFACIMLVQAIFSNCIAQQKRLIREPTLGVEFTAPQGWQYQLNDIGYLMGHNTMPRIILVTSSPATTVAELRQNAIEGIHEEGGTALQLEGELTPFGSNGLAGTFKGIME